MRRSLSVCVVVFLSVAAVAAPISVVKTPGAGKEGLSLDGLRGGGEMGQLFIATLKSDLERSGWFRVESGAGGVRVSGTAAGSAEAVRTSLEVAGTPGRFTWGETAQGKNAVRRQAHRLSDAIVERMLGKKGMAATRIVFVGKRGGRSDLYFCDADGFGLAQLTQDGVACLSPYWDPSAEHIYYTTFLRGFPCIYRVPATGGMRQPLARFTGLNTGGAVSPDRALMALVLSVSGNPELYVLNLNTRNVTRLTHTPTAVEASPTWSPDGRSIAYVSDVTGRPQVYVIQESTKTPRRLTLRGSENVAPDWGPDGRIAYCTRQAGYQIAVLDPSTGESQVITSGPDHEDPSWAPDGRHIVCSRAEGRARSLYVLDTLGDDPIRLFTLDGLWTTPDWSER